MHSEEKLRVSQNTPKSCDKVVPFAQLSSMGPKPTKNIFGGIEKFLDPPPPARKLRWLVLVCEKIIFGLIRTCAVAHFFGLPE